MSNDNFRLAEPNVAYIGEGVTIKGEINVPDVIVVEGAVEGDVTARSVRIGTSGSIKGNLVASEADVHGSLSENAEVKQFLLVRSTGRIEGNVTCGDVQVEKGAVLAGGVFSVSGKDAAASKTELSAANDRVKLAAAE